MDKILSTRWGMIWKHWYGKQQKNWIKNWQNVCAVFADGGKFRNRNFPDMSGVSYGSIKRFETTGQISLLSLTKLAMALELADELRDLFTQVPYRNIQEVINESKGKS